MTTSTKITATEAVEQLTGHDEIAIEKRFGKDLDSLRSSMQLRALIYADRRRKGAADKDAYDQAMSLPLKAVGDEFAEEQDEVMPEEPVTPAGEDDSPSA